ncbi:MAG: hypothetical protein RM338_13905 [Nostoc sp. DedQUE12a]|nr:hypothetical protein [Nostoc sp. DedQUE12a]
MLENSVGEKIFEDHKYKGKLATLEIEFYEIIPSKKLSTKLSISFGTIEVKIPSTNKILNRTNKTIDIKFGIKNSELYFYLKNGIMPLKERNLVINQDYNWKGNPTGTQEYPIWEFKLDNESKNGNQLQILYGFLKNEVLGILELLKADTCCELKAVLQVSVNRNYIAIIDLDDGINKKNKETKIGLLLQYLKAEIEHYVSQVAIKV